jgi:hypothetical protein
MEIQTNEQTYVRTASGQKLLSELQSQIKYALPYEHVYQNLCDFLIKNPEFDSDTEIKLENLSDIQVNLFSSMKNLYLDSDATKCAGDLSLLKPFNCNFVCDSTTFKNGQNIKLLREISKLSSIEIAFGYTLKEDLFNNTNFKFDHDKLLNEIRYEITYGYDDLIPSFLGEFIISENFPNPIEEKIFPLLFNVIEEFNIPIFIKLNTMLMLNSIENVINYFQKLIKKFQNNGQNFNKKSIVFIISESPSLIGKTLTFNTQKILEQGFSIILNIYECDLVNIAKIKSTTNENENLKSKQQEEQGEYNVLPEIFSFNKLNFINQIIQSENKKYIPQIMISNGINYKLQLKKYGGFGYANLFQNYFKHICQHMNESEINLIFRDNLLAILNYWKPPKKSIKSVKMIKCSNCGEEKPESDDLFRKFEFIYCSIKCLNNHKKFWPGAKK